MGPLILDDHDKALFLVALLSIAYIKHGPPNGQLLYGHLYRKCAEEAAKPKETPCGTP